MASSSTGQREGLGYYNIANWAAAVVEGSQGGVGGVRVGGYVRLNTKQRPFGVVNDFVGSAVGIAIGLPIPPGALIRTYGETYGYMCLAFSDKGDRLPPALLGPLASERPWEASGIIAFDQWIANTDRHDENLAYTKDLGVTVFDHDLSLINNPPNGDPQDSLKAGFDVEVSGHVLAPHIVTASFLGSWATRIKAVNKREIRRLVTTCRTAKLITPDLDEALVNFIVHRQSRVLEYIDRTRAEFSNITAWTFEEGAVADDA